MLVGRIYETVEDYYWPGVLAVVRIDTWPLRDGGSEQYALPLYLKEAYRGPCHALITEVWSLIRPDEDLPDIMMPLPIDLATPFFSLNIGPTLHVGMRFTFTSGTLHPKYEYAGTAYDYPETTPSTWPESVQAPPAVTPYMGGFIKRTALIYPPSYSTT